LRGSGAGDEIDPMCRFPLAREGIAPYRLNVQCVGGFSPVSPEKWRRAVFASNLHPSAAFKVTSRITDKLYGFCHVGLRAEAGF
jgi:hypothetical protein